MGRSNFVNKLDGLHKGAFERILKLWYIKEASIYEIAADLKVTKESAYNLLSAARCRLEKILTTQRQLLPVECQDIIRYLLD